ncbi:hypothetical protein SAMD00019534_029740 [Acytostelium subglobosum LB1]|uniref:hypothetical protein n=1 Tax=Acytostelium subglobosum LB1 TaxID=1410327 RepID=UPI000644E2FA|nr:hypothetical protein SAMD00019534_029740 [Acytostelium subglobosum LB1]GAM19799.1 hypothetical protein SAMD00019534_029740 [Acytostelium subglobosum LB1]|eukprot:XP_012756561.1 hypothetical protein SAMD00019534_029740 [Acytostelium subglobosum LB1]
MLIESLTSLINAIDKVDEVVRMRYLAIQNQLGSSKLIKDIFGMMLTQNNIVLVTYLIGKFKYLLNDTDVFTKSIYCMFTNVKRIDQHSTQSCVLTPAMINALCTLLPCTAMTPGLLFDMTLSCLQQRPLDNTLLMKLLDTYDQATTIDGLQTGTLLFESILNHSLVISEHEHLFQHAPSSQLRSMIERYSCIDFEGLMTKMSSLALKHQRTDILKHLSVEFQAEPDPQYFIMYANEKMLKALPTEYPEDVVPIIGTPETVNNVELPKFTLDKAMATGQILGVGNNDFIVGKYRVSFQLLPLIFSQDEVTRTINLAIRHRNLALLKHFHILFKAFMVAAPDTTNSWMENTIEITEIINNALLASDVELIYYLHNEMIPWFIKKRQVTIDHMPMDDQFIILWQWLTKISDFNLRFRGVYSDAIKANRMDIVMHLSDPTHINEGKGDILSIYTASKTLATAMQYYDTEPCFLQVYLGHRGPTFLHSISPEVICESKIEAFRELLTAIKPTRLNLDQPEDRQRPAHGRDIIAKIRLMRETGHIDHFKHTPGIRPFFLAACEAGEHDLALSIYNPINIDFRDAINLLCAKGNIETFNALRPRCLLPNYKEWYTGAIKARQFTMLEHLLDNSNGADCQNLDDWRYLLSLDDSDQGLPAQCISIIWKHICDNIVTNNVALCSLLRDVPFNIHLYEEVIKSRHQLQLAKSIHPPIIHLSMDVVESALEEKRYSQFNSIISLFVGNKPKHYHHVIQSFHDPQRVSIATMALENCCYSPKLFQDY